MAVKCEELNEKYNSEHEIKIYLATKLRELEGMQLKISTDMIQQYKESAVFFTYIFQPKKLAKQKSAELSELAEKLEKENTELKKALVKKVKSMSRKLKNAKEDKEKLGEIFKYLYEFFTTQIQSYIP